MRGVDEVVCPLERRMFRDLPSSLVVRTLPFKASFPGGLVGKESACNVFNPWVRKIPWRRKWQPTPVSLPGKSHRQKSLVGYSHGITKVGHDLMTKPLPPLQMEGPWIQFLVSGLESHMPCAAKKKNQEWRLVVR